MELDGGVGVARQLAALAAVVVGKPDNAALVIALDEHDARAGAHIAAHRGQRHGVGLRHFGADGFFQPLVKLLQGGGVRSVFVQLGTLVALAKVCDGCGHFAIVQCTRPPSAALGQEQGRELTLRNLDCQQKNAGWDLIPPLFCCPAAWLRADRPPENLTMPTLNINGKDTAVNADDSTPILWALRDTLGMTGTKFGCGQALCGACTVHLNGAPVRSCVTPISAAVGQKITTIEAIAADDKVGKAVHAAWVKHDVAQCGYCQSGQIMSATALLKGKKKPTDADIDAAMAGNVCRCGTYVRIRAAIHDAAKSLA